MSSYKIFTVADLQYMQEKLDALCPVDRIPHSLRLHPQDSARLCKMIPTATSASLTNTSVGLTGQLAGLLIFSDPLMEPRRVRVFNVKGDLIETIILGD